MYVRFFFLQYLYYLGPKNLFVIYYILFVALILEMPEFCILKKNLSSILLDLCVLLL